MFFDDYPITSVLGGLALAAGVCVAAPAAAGLPGLAWLCVTTLTASALAVGGGTITLLARHPEYSDWPSSTPEERPPVTSDGARLAPPEPQLPPGSFAARLDAQLAGREAEPGGRSR